MDGDSGGNTVVQKVDKDPWSAQQAPLTFGFGEARNIYDSDQPQYYPNSTVVPFSGQSEAGLQQTEARAAAGNPLVGQAQGLAGQQLSGDYLSGNPFFQGAFDAQVRPAVEQYQNVVAPGIESIYAGGATSRGSSNQAATGRQMGRDTMARALADTAGKLAFQNYGAERGIQQGAMAAAPGLAAQDYMDPAALMGVGQEREAQAGLQLQDQINRFNFGENIDANKLAQYMGLIGGGYGASSTRTSPVQSRSTGGSLLGGAFTGAGIGNMIKPGQTGAGWGAGLGGLMGLFG